MLTLDAIATMTPEDAKRRAAEIRKAHGEYVSPREARMILRNRAKPVDTGLNYGVLIDANLRATALTR